MKRYSDRDWKSAQNSAATKANTAITATENKIESTGMTTSSCPMFVCREIRHGSLTPINGAVPNGRWAFAGPAEPQCSTDTCDAELFKDHAGAGLL